MSRPQPMRLALFLGAVIVVYALATLAKGGLYVGNYEGDTAHILDLAMRLQMGQVPHVGFETPLGVMAYAPISLFLSLGQGAGHAVMLAQVLAAIVVLPAVWWVASSRLNGPLAFFFGFYVLVLVLALSQGQSSSAVSLAMHYNRWAWAIGYVVVLASVLPSHRKVDPADGLVIGVGMALLALTKLTYFVGFAVPVLAALLMRRQLAVLAWALVGGIVVAAVVTLWQGVGFWSAYLGDIIKVATSDVRPYPNKPLMEMLRLPNYMGGTLLVLLTIILLRQAKQQQEGLIMLLLAPGVFYIMFQNFGNDPQWMVLFAVLIIAMRPQAGVVNGFGWDMRQALSLTAAGIAALASPAALNMIYSPMVHFNADQAEYSAFLPNRPEHADILGEDSRSYELKANIRLDVPETAPMVRALVPEQEVTVLNGEDLPACEIFAGAVGFFRSLAEELETAGFARDTRFLVTDIVNVVWLFGDFDPLPGGGPWYYGGAPGLENADYVLVPTCPYRMSERHRILGVIEDRGIALEEVYRSEAMIFLKVSR